MDLKRLRSFVAVAELGSVSAAAEKLRITQPALSRQLQELQAELGLRLFARVGRRLRLSAQGTEFLAPCRDLVRGADALVERARALQDGESGVFRVGATPHAIANLLPGFLGRFAAVYPRVRVEAVEGGSFDQLRMLKDGELQAILSMRMPAEMAIACQMLATAHIVAVFNPARFHLAGGGIDVRAMHQLPVLVLKGNYGTRREFDAACRLEAVSPVVAHESTAPETLLALARVGQGIAILPTTARLDADQLWVRPLVLRGHAMTMDLVIMWNAQRSLTAYGRVFTQMLGEHVRQVIPPVPSPARARRRVAGGKRREQVDDVFFASSCLRKVESLLACS